MFMTKRSIFLIEIPHIQLFYELDETITPVVSSIEPVHAYLYTLSSRPSKKDLVLPSGFYFLLASRFDPSHPLDVIIDLYRDVSLSLLVLSEIERVKDDFSSFTALKALLLTLFALKDNIKDISLLIKKIRAKEEKIPLRQTSKTLFLYTESVRAILEELSTLKSILLEEVMSFKQLLLTKEPLDLKGDLE